MTGDTDRWRGFYWHLLLISNLTFAHPVFALLNQQPEFLLAHDLLGMSLLAWTLTVALAAGLAFNLLIFCLGKLVPRAEAAINLSALFFLFGSFAFVHLNRTFDMEFGLHIGIALAAAAALTWLYRRTVFLKTFLSVTAFLIVVTPVMFLLHPNVRQIALPQTGGGETPTGRSTANHPVVLIVLDELSTPALLDTKGQVNGQRFPNLAEFSERSTWYKYATTGAEATLLAVPEILTGRQSDPGEKKLPLAANFPENLFTLLQHTHRVNAIETFTQLCPASLCNAPEPDWKIILEDTLVVFAHIALPDPYKQDLPRIDKKWAGFMRDADERPNRRTDQDLHPHHRYKLRLEKLGLFLQDLAGINRNSLNYLHFLMPHSPWMYLPDGSIYSNAERRSFTGILPAGTEGLTYRKQTFSQQHVMDFVQQRYLLQAGYTDMLLGEIFSTLREREMFDDALIVIMADHGISFRPGVSQRDASRDNFEDIMSIPLFIKYPGQQSGRVDSRPVSTVDILPTVLDSLGYDGTHEPFDGRSLIGPETPHATELSILKDTGESLTVPFAEYRSRFDNAVASRAHSFANGSFDALYELNGASLVNRQRSELPVGDPADFSMRLDSAFLYDDVRTGSGTIPSLIRANRDTGSAPFDPARVAVAVNGVIRGISRLERIESVPFDYQVVVSPEAFRDGPNSVEFLAVTETSDGVTLHPIGSGKSRKAGIRTSDSGGLVLELDAAELTVAQRGNSGVVRLTPDLANKQLRLTGWSAMSDSGQVASDVYFFAGNRLLATSRPGRASDEAKAYTGHESAERSGFNVSVPLYGDGEDPVKPFTAVALFNDGKTSVAGELRYENAAQAMYRTKRLASDSHSLNYPKNKSPVIIGREYNFADDEQAQALAGFGWARAGGSKGRWNTSQEAQLVFSVPDRRDDLRIEIEATPFFVEELHEKQLIEVILPSGAVQAFRFERGRTKKHFAIEVPSSEIADDGTVNVLLMFPDAASPASLGVNKDRRLLALYLRTVRVVAD